MRRSLAMALVVGLMALGGVAQAQSTEGMVEIIHGIAGLRVAVEVNGAEVFGGGLDDPSLPPQFADLASIEVGRGTFNLSGSDLVSSLADSAFPAGLELLDVGIESFWRTSAVVDGVVILLPTDILGCGSGQFRELAIVQYIPGLPTFDAGNQAPAFLEGASAVTTISCEEGDTRTRYFQAGETGASNEFANPHPKFSILTLNLTGFAIFLERNTDLSVVVSGTDTADPGRAWAYQSETISPGEVKTAADLGALATDPEVQAFAAELETTPSSSAGDPPPEESDPNEGDAPEDEVADQATGGAGEEPGATGGAGEDDGQSETEPEEDPGGESGIGTVIGWGVGIGGAVGLLWWLFGRRRSDDSGASDDEDEEEPTDLSGLISKEDDEKYEYLDGPRDPPTVDWGDGPGPEGWDEEDQEDEGGSLWFGPEPTEEGGLPAWVLGDELTASLAKGFAAFDRVTQYGADLIAGASGDVSMLSGVVTDVVRGGREAVHEALDQAVTDGVKVLDGLLTYAVPELASRLGSLFEPPEGGWPRVGLTLDEEVAWLNLQRTTKEIISGVVYTRQDLIDARSMSPAREAAFDPWDRLDWRLIVFASHYTYYSLEDLVTLQMHKRIFYFVRDAHDPRVHWEVVSDKVVGAGESIMGAVDGWQTIVNSPGEAFGQLPGGVALTWDGTKQRAGQYADSARRGDEAFVRTTLKGTVSFSIDAIIGKYFDDHFMPRLLPKAPDAPPGKTSGAMDTAKGGELILDEAGDVVSAPDGPVIPFQVIDDLADSGDDLPPLPAPPSPTPDLSWPVTPDGQPLPTSGLTQAQIDAGDVGHMPLSWFRAQKRFAIPDEFPDLAPGMRDWTPQQWADHIDYLLSNEGAYGIAPGVRVVPPRKGTVPTRLQIHSNSCLLECFRSVLVALKQRLPSSKSLQYHSQRLDDWKGTGLDPDALENLIESGKPWGIFDDGLMVTATEIRNAPSPFDMLKFMHQNLKDQEWIIRLEWKKADGTPDGGHAVRLEAIEGDKVFISDPGLPPGVSLEMPKAVFDKLATHVWNLTVAQ